MSYVNVSGLGARLVLESNLAETAARATESATQSWENGPVDYEASDENAEVTDTAMTVGAAVLAGTVIIAGVLLLRKVA